MKLTAKITAMALCGAVCLGLGACGASGSAATDSGKLSIVCTGFSGYDWTRQLLGDRADEVNLTYLLENGVDLHSYQPSVADIALISDCDVFVYVGGESETWVEDALKNSRNKDMQVIKLLDVADAKEEEVKEGMQAEEEEEEGEEPEYDEHVWLSIKNAEKFTAAIADALCEADSENADSYRADLEAYNARLSALDESFGELINGASQKTLVFGDRFPFRYFCDDYGLDYYAAFVGCSAETEASFETIAFLAQKVDEIGADTVFVIENSDGRIAQSIISNTQSKSQKTAVLNSLQSVSKQQIKDGATYISLMEENYSVLEDALK